MARSRLTGTEKKEKKREIKDIAELRKEAVKDVKRQRPFTRGARREFEAISHGKHLPVYKPEAEYKKTSLHQLKKDFARATKGAEKIFAPIREEAISNFEQEIQPELVARTGAGTSGSSAMNQALAAAKGNLQRSLASDFSTLQANLAQNLLGQRESSRQFGAQFENQQEQFRNQSDLQRLQARMQSNAYLLGQPPQPIMSGLSGAPSYLTKEPQPSTAAVIGTGIVRGASAALMAKYAPGFSQGAGITT